MEKCIFFEIISASDYSKWDVYIKEAKEGVRKHNNKSHKQFFFGSLPCNTLEERGNTKDLEKSLSEILIFTFKLIMCLEKIVKKKSWRMSVDGKSDILEVWCLRYSSLQDSCMVKCKKLYDLKAGQDNMQENVLQK